MANKKRKNVLFIKTDQWQGDSLRIVENPAVKIHNLDQLGKEEEYFL